MSDAFVPRPSHPSTEPPFAGAALLDAEKLDCYRIALEFQAIAGQFMPKRDELRDRARSLLVRIVQMLSRLVARMCVAGVPQS
jgi:hypothetical protein